MAVRLKDGKESLQPSDDLPSEGDVEEIIVKSRKKPTPEGYLNQYDDLISYLDIEIDRKSREMEKGVRTLRRTRKALLQMKKDLPKLRISKKTFASQKKGSKVLSTPVHISTQLADFLQVPHDTLLSRKEVTRAIVVYCNARPEEDREEFLRWSYLNTGRNLQNPKDRRFIIPDDNLSKLLRFDQYQQDVANGLIMKKVKDKITGQVKVVPVTSPALSYISIQRLLKIHYWNGED